MRLAPVLVPLLLVPLLLVACSPPEAAGPKPTPEPTNPGAEPPTIPTEPTGSLPAISVQINEVQPSNESTWQPDVGDDTPDWIELLNTGIEPIDLNRLEIALDRDEKWAPKAGILEPGAFLVISADEITDDDEHAPFNLDSDALSTLTLYVDGFSVQEIKVPPMGSDLSYAVFDVADAAGAAAPTWLRTAEPSPGAENGVQLDSDDPRDFIFRPFVMHQFKFTLTEQAFHELDEGSRPEVAAELEVDGMYYDDASVRLRGQSSYDQMDGKPQFLIDWNDVTAGQKWRGIEKLSTHNGNAYDPTRQKHYGNYGTAEGLGIPSAQIGWAELYFNDTYYGTYVLIERYDDEWIQRHYPNQVGTGMVFEPSEDGGATDFGGGDGSIDFDYEEGPDIQDPDGLASMQGLVDLMEKTPTDANIETLWTYVDKDAFLGYIAWENHIQSYDGYKTRGNWGFYVDGESHLILWLPRGAEYTFGWDLVDWASNGAVADFCFSNLACTRLVAEKFLQIADWLDAESFATEQEDIALWLDTYLDADPRSPHSANTVDNERTRYFGILNERPQALRAAVGDKFPDMFP